MLKRLICELPKTKAYISGNALHGIIMEHIAVNYADELHFHGLKPYSQYIKANQDSLYWVIQTLTQEADQQIITPISSDM